MSERAEVKKLASVTLPLGEQEGKIERLLVDKTGREEIRLSWWSEDCLLACPLCLSEDELVALLRKAIRQEVLSPDFLERLHADSET
jgi:hypothetical protein